MKRYRPFPRIKDHFCSEDLEGFHATAFPAIGRLAEGAVVDRKCITCNLARDVCTCRLSSIRIEEVDLFDVLLQVFLFEESMQHPV